MITPENIAASADSTGAGGGSDTEIVASPCTSVCRIDADTGWCQGCWRRLDEIAGWSAMTAHDRRCVLARVAERRGAEGAK